jgi:hypothetical protein
MATEYLSDLYFVSKLPYGPLYIPYLYGISLIIKVIYLPDLYLFDFIYLATIRSAGYPMGCL